MLFYISFFNLHDYTRCTKIIVTTDTLQLSTLLLNIFIPLAYFLHNFYSAISNYTNTSYLGQYLSSVSTSSPFDGVRF